MTHFKDSHALISIKIAEGKLSAAAAISSTLTNDCNSPFSLLLSSLFFLIRPSAQDQQQMAFHRSYLMQV